MTSNQQIVYRLHDRVKDTSWKTDQDKHSIKHCNERCQTHQLNNSDALTGRVFVAEATHSVRTNNQLRRIFQNYSMLSQWWWCFHDFEQPQLKYISTWMDGLERICYTIQCCNDDDFFAQRCTISVEISFPPGQSCQTSDCLRWTCHLPQSTSGWTFPSCSCGLVGRDIWAIKSDILVLGHKSVICSSNLKEGTF